MTNGVTYPMRWRALIYLLLATLITINLVLLYRLIVESVEQEPVSEVTILHINDIYRIGGIDEQTKGGLARVAWLRKDLERQGQTVLVTHAGDALSPALLSDMYKGEKMIEILNLLAGDQSSLPLLFTIGNHEFDHAECTEADDGDNFNVLQNRIRESNFIWLDGNLDYSRNVAGEECFGWDDGATSSKREAFINIPVNGINLGFFGLTVAPAASDKDMPSNIKDNAAAAREFVRALRDDSDIVIGLTHLDEEDDVAILSAPLHSAPDLILGGHDHDYRACVDHGEVPGLKRLYKGNAEALEVVLIHIRKDDGGKVSYAQQRIALDEHIAQDPAVQARIDAIMSEHQARFCEADAKAGSDEPDPRCLEEKIGTTTTDWVLEEYRNRAEETVVGNWLTRLMLESYEAELPQEFCTDSIGIAALFLSGSLRLNFDLAAGRDVTRRTIEELLPFDRQPQVAICVAGETVYQSVMHGLSDRYDGAWPHYSGLVAGSSQDGGMTLSLVGEHGETEVSPDSKERVVLIVQEYVANGGDGYPIVKDDTQIVSEFHVFSEGPTMKSLLTDAIEVGDDPSPMRDWPDNRKEWGITRDPTGDVCAAD